MNPLVSILIPAYNCESYIEKCLSSILNQTYRNIEILICDDGSKDKTRYKIDSINDDRIKVYHNDFNIGNLKTINQLLSISRGEFITFQDADDFSGLNRIFLQVDFLSKNESVSLCGTQYYFLDNRNINEINDLPLNHKDIVSYINNHGAPPYCAASCMFRRDVYETIGGFRAFFNRIGAADSDWYFRVSQKFQVANLPESLYYYRKNLNSFTNKISTNLNKLISHDIAFFLYQQRIEKSNDSLERNSFTEIENFSREKLKDFRKDPSLIYNKMANYYIERKDLILSLKNILIGIVKRPFMKKNYTLLKYCLWKFKAL